MVIRAASAVTAAAAAAAMNHPQSTPPSGRDKS